MEEITQEAEDALIFKYVDYIVAVESFDYLEYLTFHQFITKCDKSKQFRKNIMNLTKESEELLEGFYTKYTEIQMRMDAEIVKFKDFTTKDYKFARAAFAKRYPKLAKLE